jgi:Proliferating cell nuclear antigen, N-terminal domain
MFEAKLAEAGLLKKIVDSMKDLVTDGKLSHTNFMNLTSQPPSFAVHMCLSQNTPAQPYMSAAGLMYA